MSTPRPDDLVDCSETAFLEGGGELGALMRAHDWTATPLGAPATWPRSLKTAVRILLTSRQPFWLGWGEELTYLYNDPYKAIIGGKHPSALGRPFREVWSEIWDIVGPMADQVMTRDEGTYHEAMFLLMERHGYREETYYTFSYSPIPDDDGGPGGLICANTDDTRRVLGERQLATLRELAARTGDARSWLEVCQRSVDAAATNGRDIPFVLVYAFDAAGEPPVLAAASAGTEALADPATWALTAGANHAAVRVVDLDESFGAIPTGAWDTAPTRAAILPIAASGQAGRRGALVIGLNPCRLFDDGYRGFLELFAKQVAAGIANADAYEQERQRAESLAQIDRAKTEFFSNVSHEFRTPLTLMLGPLEDTLAGADRLADDDRERLDVAHKNALRLLKLVNTLLDFSRIEAGRVEASYQPVDLGSFTAELASLFRSAIERAGLRLVIECPPLDERCYVDREMWEKLVFNLLSNAFKFTFEGEIEVRVRRAGNRVSLTVRDTGTGIPEDELPHLFERFRRVRGARGRSLEGSGIGLSLVQELVRLHGGEVAVTSALDRGSTFEVSLPTGTAHLPAERIGAARTMASTSLRSEAYVEELIGWLSDGSAQPLEEATFETSSGIVVPAEDRPRVLLADDNSDMREYVRRLLSPHYHVEAVGDGRRALDAVRARPPDLVVTDVMMPELDGFELLEAIRADDRLHAIPVIMLSARAGEEARVEGLGAGADDYLAKPFSARELLARVSARIELSRLQARLAEERGALRSLFAQTPVATAVLRGPRFVFELANPAYLEVVGGRDVAGKPLLEALPELAGQRMDELLRQVMHTGEPYVGTDMRIRLDRSGTGVVEDTYWTFIYAPLRNHAGDIDSVIAICNDVTDQVRARSAIQHSEARYRHIFESVGVSIWEEDFSAIVSALDELQRSGVSDIRGYCRDHPEFVRDMLRQVRIVDVNGVTLEMFGVADKEALIEAMDRLRPKNVELSFLDTLVALAEGKPFLESEAQMRTLDGAPIDVLFTISFPPPEQELKSVLITLVDITARKRAERALRESDRRKDEFIAMLGHELRNPLAAIRSATQLMELTRPDDPRVMRAIDVLERQSTHMNRLIDGLLEVSRISRGKIELELEPLDLRKTIESVLADRAGQIASRGLVLETALPTEPAWVHGDPVRLAQVFDNLVGNAVKFTDPAGVIAVTLATERERERATVSVRDTGIGIRPEACATIFEAFQQEVQDAARTAGGLGLGLALAKGLLHLHGGDIEAHSEGPGKGAEFRVMIPLTSLRPERAAERAVEGGNTRRILLVEDNDDAAEMLSELLQLKGHAVTIARDGNAALAALRDREFDVALCDLGLPGMDGYALARTIRADSARGRIPLVALTGYGQEADQKKAAEVGFDAHLLKPVELDALDQLLHRLMGMNGARITRS